MNKNNSIAAYLLIGIGIYFFLKQFDIPFIKGFDSWPTLLITIGIVFLLHSFKTRDYENLFIGIIILGLGIHFYGLKNYPFWPEHWTIYPFIIGIAYLLRFFKTKNGLFPGILLTGISSIMLFSVTVPSSLSWIYHITDLLESFWPIAMIVLGIYLLIWKK